MLFGDSVVESTFNLDDFIRRTEDGHIVFQHPNPPDGKPAWLKTAAIVAKAAGKVIKAYGSKDPVGDAADQADLDYLEDIAKAVITPDAEAWLERDVLPQWAPHAARYLT